jgi:DNA replication and repair protein RecF
LNFERLELQGFRLYDRQAVEFAPGVNILSGQNASGKTTILEALSVLGTGRSFRGAADLEMTRSGDSGYSLRGRYSGRHGSHPVEVSFRAPVGALPARKESSLDGHPLTQASDLLGRIPLLAFTPDDLALVKGGPAERRKFIDLLLAQTSPAYRDCLWRYHRTRAQRNALLAGLASRRVGHSAAAAQIEPWDEALEAESHAVQEARRRVVTEVRPPAAAAFAAIDGREMNLHYQPDPFDRGRGSEELRRGLTLSGAHRDELVFTVHGEDARRFASQGQQRSVVLALKLAALEVLEGYVGETPVLLLDDVLSELDPGRAAALWPLLVRGQAFVTTTDAAVVERALAARGLSGIVGARFSVEGGEVHS